MTEIKLTKRVKYAGDVFKELTEKAGLPIDLAADFVNNIPDADAVPVVRCRECKHLLAPKVCANPMACGWDALEPDDDDFCSRGEKKDGGADNA